MLNIRKLIATTALLAATTSVALADEPYFGAGLGIQNASSYNGIVSNIFAGYGATVGENFNYYLGAELFANIGSLPLSSSHYNRTTYGVGISLMPGIYLNEYTIAYIRVGLENSHFSRNNSAQTGSQLGAGLQTRITNNWDVRAEYVYTGKGIINNFNVTRSNQFNMGLIYKLN